MERGDKVQITIEDISTEGQGIGKADGLAVFVREAVIGDFVLAELTKVKKNYAFGRVAEYTRLSLSRQDVYKRQIWYMYMTSVYSNETIAFIAAVSVESTI